MHRAAEDAKDATIGYSGTAVHAESATTRADAEANPSTAMRFESPLTTAGHVAAKSLQQKRCLGVHWPFTSQWLAGRELT